MNCATCERYAACSHPDMGEGQMGWGCDDCGMSGYWGRRSLHVERGECLLNPPHRPLEQPV